MNCLVVASTVKELSLFLRHYRNSDNQQEVDVLITGIGLAATTYALTKQIAIKRPDLIIQAGIAGCFDKNISLGSVVVVKQDVFADLSVIENNELKTMFDLGLVFLNQAPFQKGLLINPGKALIRKTKLKAVKGVSVNQVTTNKQMIRVYQKKFQPVVESMEGAALHYVCLMEKIPFLQIRGLSNYIGERDKKKWKMKEAVVALNNELIKFITNY